MVNGIGRLGCAHWNLFTSRRTELEGLLDLVYEIGGYVVVGFGSTSTFVGRNRLECGRKFDFESFIMPKATSSCAQWLGLLAGSTGKHDETRLGILILHLSLQILLETFRCSTRLRRLGSEIQQPSFATAVKASAGGLSYHVRTPLRPDPTPLHARPSHPEHPRYARLEDEALLAAGSDRRVPAVHT